MKLSSKLILLTVISVAVVLFVLNQKHKQTASTPDENEMTTESYEASNKQAATSYVAPTSEKKVPTATSVKTSQTHHEETPLYQQGPLSTKEVESVNNIVKTISHAIAKKSHSNDFMKAIQALHLRPKFIDEGNNALGSMVTVRTHDALEGTRYLHAQFTGEKNNADYLQHVSFQIRPGSNSFQKAVEILDQFLPKNKKVKESFSDYILYSTDDGYVAWAKIANRDDLKSNKYNASSKEDVGSVIITIEQEIHDMDEDGHSH